MFLSKDACVCIERRLCFYPKDACVSTGRRLCFSAKTRVFVGLPRHAEIFMGVVQYARVLFVISLNEYGLLPLLVPVSHV